MRRKRITKLYCIVATDVDSWPRRGVVDFNGYPIADDRPSSFAYLSAREARRSMTDIWFDKALRKAAKPEVVVFRRVR
jgi:hypothetical protein